MPQKLEQGGETYKRRGKDERIQRIQIRRIMDRWTQGNSCRDRPCDDTDRNGDLVLRGAAMKKIILRRRRLKKYGWHAELEGSPSVFGIGATRKAAIYMLISFYPHVFKIEIDERQTPI